MDFQASTHKSTWLLSAEDLKCKRKANRDRAIDDIKRLRLEEVSAGPIGESGSQPEPSGEPGKLRPLKLEEEAVLLRFYGGKAQDMCRAFQFPPKVAAAALAYLARFYTGCSILDHHPRDIMLTAVYLACKVEESYISAEELCRVVRQDPDTVLRTELLLLQGLRFDLITHNPLRPLDGFFRDLANCRSAAGPSGSGGDGGSSRPYTNGDEGTNQSVNDNRGVPVGRAALNGSTTSGGDSATGDTSSDRESPPLDDGLLRVSDGQLARAREAAANAAGLLLRTDAVLLFPPGQIALAAMRTAFRKIQVQFSSYLARVAHLAQGQPTSAGTAEGNQPRLESLQDALARIDTFGAMAAEAIDEAQVRKIDRKWKLCHNPLYDPTTNAYKRAEAEEASKRAALHLEKVRNRQQIYAATVLPRLGQESNTMPFLDASPVGTTEPPPDSARSPPDEGDAEQPPTKRRKSEIAA